MKTLEDEWYAVINVCKLKLFLYYRVLHVHTIPISEYNYAQ